MLYDPQVVQMVQKAHHRELLAEARRHKLVKLAEMPRPNLFAQVQTFFDLLNDALSVRPSRVECVLEPVMC